MSKSTHLTVLLLHLALLGSRSGPRTERTCPSLLLDGDGGALSRLLPQLKLLTAKSFRCIRDNRVLHCRRPTNISNFSNFFSNFSPNSTDNCVHRAFPSTTHLFPSYCRSTMSIRSCLVVKSSKSLSHVSEKSRDSRGSRSRAARDSRAVSRVNKTNSVPKKEFSASNRFHFKSHQGFVQKR